MAGHGPRGPVVRVEGARQLRAALKRAEGGLADLRAVNARAAAVAAVAGRTEAPRQTGALAASVRSSGTQAAAIVRAGSTAVPYAAVIHYGWAARHIRPNPYLLEGAEQTEPAWLALYRQEIDRLIDRVEREAHP